jgi:hypothetical protein
LTNSGRASAQDQPKIPACECKINVAGPNLLRRTVLAAFKHLFCTGKPLRIGIVRGVDGITHFTCLESWRLLRGGLTRGHWVRRCA